MRYMMLIYTKETENGPTREDGDQIKAAHWAVMQEATGKGVLRGAEPLAPTATATTVRVQNGKSLITDGPFAELRSNWPGITSWIARIWTKRSSGRTACKGGEGCIEIRPMLGVPALNA